MQRLQCATKYVGPIVIATKLNNKVVVKSMMAELLMIPPRLILARVAKSSPDVLTNTLGPTPSGTCSVLGDVGA